ncbi:hypothetical protein [Treponema sp.]|uniref:hypothetical protein n=1 Tax=Treponema sp. TaxID=166 RepID=UPI0025CEA822|nr:hypothetical protein [Treponema sp.]MCR5219255.1 hypothetical protein [Treponema sp.]
MKVLHFHKDTVFTLCNYTRQLLKETCLNYPGIEILPVWPLSLFLEDEESDYIYKNLSDLILEKVSYSNTSQALYLDFKCTFKEDSLQKEKSLKIKIADIKKSGNPLPLTEESAFMKVPDLKISVLQFSDLILKNNSWTFFNTRWLKLKK